MDMEREITKVLQKLSEIDAKLDNALSQLGDHEKRLRAIEGKSGKQWEAVVSQVISIAVAAAIAYFVSK